MDREEANREISPALLQLEADSTVPRYRQVYGALQRGILEGRLRPGQRLPASRVFAAELGVSRNTILLAFDQLMAEGYLKSKRGSGTFISDDLPEGLLHAEPHASLGLADVLESPALSERGRRMVEIPLHPKPEAREIRPLKAGVPALDAFPYEVWGRIASQQLRVLPRSAFAYGDPAGHLPLRETISAYVRTARAVRCEPEQVVIVSGSQQGLDLAARVLLDEGETAWIEDPGYLGTRGALRGAGIRLVPVPVDAEGLQVEVGKAKAPEARMVYVTPSYQYPMGVTLSLARRLALLQWAEERGMWIVEDDYDSEYRYAGRPLAALQGLDTGGRVIYLGTFSKVLFPGLRLGYLVVPPGLVEAFVKARHLADRHSPVLEQATLAHFIEEGHFVRHLRRMRVLYETRRDTLVEAVERHLGGFLEVQPADAGMHAVGWLTDAAEDEGPARRAAQAGVTVSPLSVFSLQHRPPPGFLLGYAAYEEKDIERAVRRLAQVWLG